MKPPITLILAPGIEAQFKKLAKKMFPVEAFSYLLGTIAGGTVNVDELWIPENLADHATPLSVELPPEWAIDAGEYAEENDLMLLGDIHTHTYLATETTHLQDRVPSEKDLDLSACILIAGICNVQQLKRKGKPYLRASIRWWGPTSRIEVRREKKGLPRIEN